MKMPAWVFGDGSVDDEPDQATATVGNQQGFDVNKLVMDTLDILEGLSDVEKTKYVKVFQHSETALGIYHTKVKSLAKEKGLEPPQFLAQKKNYPSFVTLKTENLYKDVGIILSWYCKYFLSILDLDSSV